MFFNAETQKTEKKLIAHLAKSCKRYHTERRGGKTESRKTESAKAEFGKAMSGKAEYTRPRQSRQSLSP